MVKPRFDPYWGTFAIKYKGKYLLWTMAFNGGWVETSDYQEIAECDIDTIGWKPRIWRDRKFLSWFKRVGKIKLMKLRKIAQIRWKKKLFREAKTKFLKAGGNLLSKQELNGIKNIGERRIEYILKPPLEENLLKQLAEKGLIKIEKKFLKKFIYLTNKGEDVFKFINKDYEKEFRWIMENWDGVCLFT